jgi:predicted acylesterase/phospholipase RssA
MLLNGRQSARTASDLHLVCGSGGSRAILGCGGAVLACQLAGLNKFKTIGGISGGSVPAALYASGFDAKDLLKLAVQIDFSSLLTRRENPISILLAFFLQERFVRTRPRKGVMSSENLGYFIDSKVPSWPKNFWTMAVAGKTQVLFTADGVYQYLVDGTCRKLSDEPPPVGLAVRATCAVPGIIDPVEYKGLTLFDGALSWDGQCPVGLVKRHFGAHPETIIGCDVGDQETLYSRFSEWFWALFCGGDCVGKMINTHAFGQQGVVMIHPKVDRFRSLQFALEIEQKWSGVMSGLNQGVAQLSEAGLFPSPEELTVAQAIATDLERLKEYAA